MPEGKTISITTGTILKTLLIGVGAWLLYYLSEIVLVVLTAVVIASAIEPAIRACIRYGLPRLVSVIAIYLVLAILLFGVFFVFLPPLLGDVTGFINALPSYIQMLNTTVGFSTYAEIFGFSDAGVAAPDLLAQVRDSLQLSGFGDAFTATASVFGGLLSFILIIIFSFYFAVNETGIDDFLRFIVPVRYRAYALDLWKRSQHKIGLWMQGQVILAVLIGVLVYLGLTILQVEHALLLAVIAAFFELIPVFGPTLAAVPAVLIAFADGGVVLAVSVIVWYVILQQFENHLIYPLVVTRVVGVPPLVVILGLIVGAKLAGFLGVLLSVPIAAALQELIRDINERRSFASEAEAT